MDASEKEALQALFGSLCILYGIAMAFFAWRASTSRYYWIFKPRWRYGVNASRGAAFVQVPMYIGAGGSLLLNALHSEYAKIFSGVFLTALVFSVGIFFVDAGTPDEP